MEFCWTFCCDGTFDSALGPSVLEGAPFYVVRILRCLGIPVPSWVGASSAMELSCSNFGGGASGKMRVSMSLYSERLSPVVGVDKGAIVPTPSSKVVKGDPESLSGFCVEDSCTSLAFFIASWLRCDPSALCFRLDEAMEPVASGACFALLKTGVVGIAGLAKPGERV